MHRTIYIAEQCTTLKNDDVLPTNRFFLTQPKQHSLDFSLDEIVKIVRSLEIHKAHNHDDMSVTMTNTCHSFNDKAKSFLRTLSLLFERSFNNSYFTELWKRTSIIPVQKNIK